MKRADIEVGKEYAVRMEPGKIRKGKVLSLDSRSARMRITLWGKLPPIVQIRVYTRILMPWEAWEAKERERKERDAAVQAERERAAADMGRLLYERISALYPIVDWNPERRTVTLRWEDLARLLVKS